MIFNYIEPIFISVKNNGNGRYTISARCQNKDFEETFTDADVKTPDESIDNILYKLSQFLPNKRRFFCGSKQNMSKVFNSKNIEAFSELLIKKVCKDIFAELLSYLDVDQYLANIGISDINEVLDPSEAVSGIDKIEKSYSAIIKGCLDDQIINESYSVHSTLEQYKASSTWVEQVKGGQDNFNELFAVCGNHMLGDNFNIDELKAEQFKTNQKIQIMVNRETAISDIQEKSMFGVQKVYISISKEDSVYKIFASSNGVTMNHEIDTKDGVIPMWTVNNVVSPKRVFIGYGDEALKYIKELVSLTVGNIQMHELFIELASTYIDINKPFEKVLIGKDLPYMMNLLGVKKTKSTSNDIMAFDSAVFNDAKKTIEKLISSCYKYLIPMSTEKFKETYEPFFRAVFGQSLKYFYNVSPEVSV